MEPIRDLNVIDQIIFIIQISVRSSRHESQQHSAIGGLPSDRSGCLDPDASKYRSLSNNVTVPEIRIVGLQKETR